MLSILLVVLIILAIGGLPTWGYHANGYGFSGLATLLLVILLVLMITGSINF